jgi:hypothetical protein
MEAPGMGTSSSTDTGTSALSLLPLDIAAMRAAARHLLGSDDAADALPPAVDEVDELTDTLRRHLTLLAPEVEHAAERLDRESIPRYCALACVGEARGKLRATPGAGLAGAVAHSRRLARVLDALCDHHETLCGPVR